MCYTTLVFSGKNEEPLRYSWLLFFSLTGPEVDNDITLYPFVIGSSQDNTIGSHAMIQ